MCRVGSGDPAKDRVERISGHRERARGAGLTDNVRSRRRPGPRRRFTGSGRPATGDDNDGRDDDDDRAAADNDDHDDHDDGTAADNDDDGTAAATGSLGRRPDTV